MSVFGFTHVNVLQRAVEVAAAFYRSADTAGEIEISQHADVVRNDDLRHGVYRHDQCDVEASSLQLFGHADRRACAKRMADQHDGADPSTLAALNGLKSQRIRKRMIGDRDIDVSPLKLFVELIDPGRQNVGQTTQ